MDPLAKQGSADLTAGRTRVPALPSRWIVSLRRSLGLRIPLAEAASRPVWAPPSWLPPLLLSAIGLALAAWFLAPAPQEFPMDDAYIYLVYARNLADHGQLMFNQPGEPGVGITSLLWTLLIAGGHAAGIPLPLMAKALGVASLVLLGIITYGLLLPHWRPSWALAGAVAAISTGNMVWFALSGMETVLFLALGGAALLALRAHKPAALGAALGLLALVRPEGLALAAAIGLTSALRREFRLRELLVGVAIGAAIALPWFGYLLWQTGHPIPTSGLAKQFTSKLGMQLLLERSPGLAPFSRWVPLTYTVGWAAYLFGFALGGSTLPGPRVPLGVGLSSVAYDLSVWGTVGLVVVILPLLRQAALELAPWISWRRWKGPRRDWLPWAALGLWILLHNLAYTIALPVPGTASRYGALNHWVLALLLVAGLRGLARWARPLLAPGLAAIVLLNTAHWNGVYDANIEHMQRVRIAAARYVAEQLPDRRCASFDIGAIRYFSARPVLDLGGLLDPGLRGRFTRGELDRYLRQHGISCLILPGGYGVPGWFDFAREVGIGRSPSFEAERVAVFRVGEDLWLRGFLPTTNYQPGVGIFLLDHAARQ